MNTLTDKLQFLYGQVHAGQRDIIAEAMAEIGQLQKDAARYRWLKSWNKTDGFNDEAIDRERAVDMAVNAAIAREGN